MATEIKVWDPLVRIFHWSLVTAFVVAFLSEDERMGLHSAAGYTVLALVALRILWGFVGSRHARFTDFVYPPRTVIGYLKSMAGGHPPRYLGHNPAGGAMIVALLGALLGTTLTGLAAYGAEGEGPLGAWCWSAGSEAEEIFEEIHEFFANLTLGLVAAHLAGVAMGSLLHGENLVRAMITGRKRTE